MTIDFDPFAPIETRAVYEALRSLYLYHYPDSPVLMTKGKKITQEELDEMSGWRKI